jgi:hypothetical protein
VSADAMAAGTQWTAWEQCGIEAAARSFGFRAQTRCKAKCCQRPKGSGTRTEVAFVEGDTQAAAVGFAALAGKRSKVLGCKANAAVMHVAEGSGRDRGIVRAAVAQRLRTGIEALSTTTVSSRREVRCKAG